MKAAAMATNADILLMMLQKDADRYLAEEKHLVQGFAFIRSRKGFPNAVELCNKNVCILTHGRW